MEGSGSLAELKKNELRKTDSLWSLLIALVKCSKKCLPGYITGYNVLIHWDLWLPERDVFMSSEMMPTFVKTRPVHSIAGQSRFLAGGPHRTHPGCLGFGSWLQEPTSKPAPFVQAWDRAQRVLGKWSGRGKGRKHMQGVWKEVVS